MRFSTHIWVVALVAALAVLPYVQTATFPFVADDKHYIAANPYLRDVRNWGLFFSREYWESLHSYRGSAPRPLLAVSLSVDGWLFGPAPAAFHITNVLLHTGASLLMAWVAWVFTRRRAAMLLVGALFAVNPAHVEAVAWVKNRSEMIAAGLALLSLGVYASRWSALPRSLAALAAYVVSLLAKVGAAGWPLLLAPYEGLVRGRRRLATPAWATLVVLGVAAAYVMGAKTQGPAERQAGDPLSPVAHGLLVCRSASSHLRFSFFGCRPGLYPDASAAPVGYSSGLLLIAAALVVGTWLAARDRRALLFWWVLFLVALLPIVNLRPMANRPIALQRAYLPSVAVAVALGLSVRRSRLKAWFVAGLVLAGATLTVHRSFAFASDRALYGCTVQAAPRHDYSLLLLGDSYLKAGRPRRAVRLCSRARKINRFRAATDYNLASAYLALDDPAKALLAAGRAGVNGLGPRAWLIQGECLERLGRLSLSAQYYQRAAASPDTAAFALNNLGNVRVKQSLRAVRASEKRERVDEAIELYRRAVSARPGFVPPRVSLRGALEMRKRLAPPGGQPK